MPIKPDRTTYTALDFLQFRESGSLELAPDFQRRSVWGTPARSFFIDSLIRGFPVPPIYLRVRQNEDGTRTIRQVIDGQQRLRSVLLFIDGDFALSKTLPAPWAGYDFQELAPPHKDAVRNFGFICEVLHGVSDREVLEIFARLNTYSVQLNAQELRNGTYFGLFKQTAYQLAHDHIEFWRQNRIVTENGIARMSEVELTSELMIVLMDGLQDKKTGINQFYADFDETFPGRDRIASRFRSVIDDITESLGDELRTTEFRRNPLFYSLFAAVAHHRFGISGTKLATPKSRLAAKERRRLRDTANNLSDVLALARSEDRFPSKYQAFVTASLRQTDNIQPRRTRLEEIFRSAF